MTIHEVANKLNHLIHGASDARYEDIWKSLFHSTWIWDELFAESGLRLKPVVMGERCGRANVTMVLVVPVENARVAER